MLRPYRRLQGRCRRATKLLPLLKLPIRVRPPKPGSRNSRLGRPRKMHGHRSGRYSPYKMPKHRSSKVPEHRSSPCKSTDTPGMRVQRKMPEQSSRKMPEHTSVASKMHEPRTGPCKVPRRRSGPSKMPWQAGPSDGWVGSIRLAGSDVVLAEPRGTPCDRPKYDADFSFSSHKRGSRRRERNRGATHGGTKGVEKSWSRSASRGNRATAFRACRFQQANSRA